MLRVVTVLSIFPFFSADTDLRAAEVSRRVLILSGYNYTFPAATLVMDGMQKRLREGPPAKISIDAEFLDLVRVGDPDHELRTATFVEEKYARRPPDLVVALGTPALQFTMKYRDAIAPHIPIVFAGVTQEGYAALAPPPDVTGMISEPDLGKTLDLAERLQPNARRLFVIDGASSADDRAWQARARHAVETHERKFETTYLFGLPFDTLISEVSRIPRDSIVVFLTFFIDGAGKTFTPMQVGKEIARVSPAPVYGPYDTYIGNGSVGGFVEPFETLGIAVADMVTTIMAGENPATLPPRVNPGQTFLVDARAMDRWGLKQGNLPPGSVILFQEPGLWEQHRGLVLATASLIGLQAIIVTALLIQRRKRRQAEASLRESDERMTFTAASANVGLWQFDRTTNELWTTEHCRTMFNLARDIPLTRDTFLAAVHPEDRQIAIGALRQALDTGQRTVAQVRITLPEDQLRWVAVRARARADDSGNPNHIDGIFVDITEQKLASADAELQRQEVTHLMRVSVLGELSGAIAHEVNQPLTAILSNAQAALYLLTLDNPNLAEIRDALQDIVQEDNRAGEVVRRLRGLLKKGETRSEPVDINELVKLTINLLHSELIGRRIVVETHLADHMPLVIGDPVQLQQVLLNLVMNAMDAMASIPPVRRLVTITSHATLAGTIQVLVRDRGPGFRPSERRKLFEPFFTTKDHGLGLGLTICSTIVQAHGGEISLANDESGGAIAGVSLPAQEIMMAAQ